MSLIRKTVGYSDIRLIETVNGTVECQACIFYPDEDYFLGFANVTMLTWKKVKEHLKRHIDAGHLVPDRILAYADKASLSPMHDPDVCDVEHCQKIFQCGWNEKSGKRRSTCREHTGKHYGIGGESI